VTAIEVHSARNDLFSMTVSINRIRASSSNPRKRFDEAALQELADSIREHGLLEPIIVRPVGGDLPTYEVIAGERRLRACQMAGLATIDVRILEGLDDQAALRLAIIENVQREDLDPIEEAEAYRRLAKMGMRQSEIAGSVQRSQPAVANRMRLLELPESVKAKISAGDLSAAHGIALASYKANSKVQEALAEIAVLDGLPSKKLEQFFAGRSYLPDTLAQYVYELPGAHPWNWEKECRAPCPHDAFRAGNGSAYGYCLRPNCYEQKQKAAKAAKEQAVETRIQQAKASGSTIVKVRDLGYEGIDYHRIYGFTKLPVGCQTGCDKRVKALDTGDLEVEICSDARCWKRLEGAATRVNNRAGRDRAKQMLIELEKRIDGLQLFGAREMAILTTLALSGYWYQGRGLEQTIERLGLSELRPAIRDERIDAAGKAFAWNRYEVLAECSQLELAKLVLETVIRREIQNLSENPQGASMPIADWYLEVDKPEDRSGVTA